MKSLSIADMISLLHQIAKGIQGGCCELLVQQIFLLSDETPQMDGKASLGPKLQLVSFDLARNNQDDTQLEQ